MEAHVSESSFGVTNAPRRTSWRRQLVLYILHLAAAYAIVRFVADPLTGWIYNVALLFRRVPPRTNSDQWLMSSQFLMSNLLVLSAVPAFLFALVANTKLRHRAACFVWIVPVCILTYNFLFNSSTIYPTIFFQSDFPAAFHYWFGGGFHLNDRAAYMRDYWRICYQFRFTAPVYAATAYSLGAWLAWKLRISALENFLLKW